jgi:hypothetical protein
LLQQQQQQQHQQHQQQQQCTEAHLHVIAAVVLADLISQ